MTLPPASVADVTLGWLPHLHSCAVMVQDYCSWHVLVIHLTSELVH